jgi:hypothetical protein
MKAQRIEIQKSDLLRLFSGWPMYSHPKRAGRYFQRDHTHSSLFVVIQSVSDGLLQKQRVASCPRCNKRLFPK